MQATQRRTEYEARPAPLPRNRVVKIEGNVAYISTAFPERRPRVAAAAKPVPRAAAKPAVKPAAKPKKGLVSTLAVVLVAFAAMAVLVSRYAVACSVGAQNNRIKQDIAAVETQIEALQVEIGLKNDLAEVQQTAQQELGMAFPDPDQIVKMAPGG